MSILFQKLSKETKFLDPRNQFQETIIQSEIRTDPLTKNTGRIAHFGGVHFQPLDLEELNRSSTLHATCPFCPEQVENVTPKFPNDIHENGRFKLGESIVFPNLSPYDSHSAVTVITGDHLVPLSDLSVERIVNALEVSIDYFNAVNHLEHEMGYGLINWNYFPMSGASQLHPHMQVFATNTPGNFLKQELESSQQYYEETGRNFWLDWINEEKRLNERYIGEIDNITWVVPFVPFSFLFDVEAVFQERTTILDLTHDDLVHFVLGLTKVFTYMQQQNLYGFNLAFYPAARKDELMWVHARLSVRGLTNPVLKSADVGTIRHLYNEPFSMIYPEHVATELRSLFL